jgi:hypothetical protein
MHARTPTCCLPMVFQCQLPICFFDILIGCFLGKSQNFIIFLSCRQAYQADCQKDSDPQLERWHVLLLCIFTSLIMLVIDNVCMYCKICRRSIGAPKNNTCTRLCCSKIGRQQCNKIKTTEKIKKHDTRSDGQK